MVTSPMRGSSFLMQSNSCSNCSNKADFLAAVQMPLEGAVIFHLFDALSITTLLSPKAVILNFLTAVYNPYFKA